MKFLSALVLTFIIACSSGLSAQTINSSFKFSQEVSQIKEGDLIEGTLTFWPIENPDLTQFKKLEKSVIFNALYVAQILSLEPSLNNADVIELKALFIVKTSKPQNVFIFKYNEIPIEIKLEGVQIEELKNKIQDYYILNQSVNGSYFMIILVCILGVLVSIAVYKRKYLLELLIKLKPDADKKARKRYDSLFRSANHRDDFELLYTEKEAWLKLLEIKTPSHNEFFKILNQYQYKKDWSNEDYNEVRTAFDVIRRSFEK